MREFSLLATIRKSMIALCAAAWLCGCNTTANNKTNGSADAKTADTSSATADQASTKTPDQAAPGAAQETAAGDSAAAKASETNTQTGARFYTGFGKYTRKVSTTNPAAQKWFNQAMQLLYGFNHDEAIRSFQAAGEADPNLAMAWWGVAYASGLHINNPAMSEKQSKQAWEATQEALKRIDHASDVEKALINAVSKRYAWPAPEDRKPLDQAYANAMEQVWKQFPRDADVGALFAESLMNLQPWDLWNRDGTPKGRTTEIVRTIERVIAMDQNHPGANHFYIHAVEASPDPDRALPSAKRLPKLVPGSGHLVHMPAHIWARVGRFDEASDANERAIKVDREYFKLAPPPEFYSMYYVHNLHFLAWSAMMEGRYATAMKAARDLNAEIPEGFLREWTYIADGFTPVTYHVLIRFGKWDEILNEPEPESYRLVSKAMHHYARGVAFSALDRVDDAKREVDEFEQAAKAIPENWQVGQNKAGEVMKVARQMLRGELAYRQDKHDEAFNALKQGVKLEEALVYDEPPGWMQPVRHALGALLMGAGRPADAEKVYREDLRAYPGNGWAILGLENACRAQKKDDAAAKYAEDRAQIWKRADVKPTSSCYCEPGT
jgi:tetratricopeptide (TPR) repeat protein